MFNKDIIKLTNELQLVIEKTLIGVVDRLKIWLKYTQVEDNQVNILIEERTNKI